MLPLSLAVFPLSVSSLFNASVLSLFVTTAKEVMFSLLFIYWSYGRLVSREAIITIIIFLKPQYVTFLHKITICMSRHGLLLPLAVCHLECLPSGVMCS